MLSLLFTGFFSFCTSRQAFYYLSHTWGLLLWFWFWARASLTLPVLASNSGYSCSYLLSSWEYTFYYHSLHWILNPAGFIAPGTYCTFQWNLDVAWSWVVDCRVPWKKECGSLLALWTVNQPDSKTFLPSYFLIYYFPLLREAFFYLQLKLRDIYYGKWRVKYVNVTNRENQ
jgi:hypothetical protein